MSLIKDVTGRKNADILAEDYNNTYPFYYKNTIWYGSFPIDTIPDIGINTQNQSILFPYTFIDDFNGDGYNDLVAATGAGQVKLWLGGKKFTEVAVQTWFGSADLLWDITMLQGDIGDVDGDGVNDFAIGLTYHPGLDFCKQSVLYIVKGDTSVKGDTTTGIRGEKILLPADFKLYSPYPNPFNSQTKIEYELKTEGLVEIKLYDTLGREIGLLLNEEKNPGKYSVEFNAEKYKLASGVYIIRAEFYKGKNLTAQQSAKITYLK